jgi:methionine--tRNA ligase beta chain
MDTITYDDFKKLDIRMGKVLGVELIEGADKLLKCQVDVGDVDEEGNMIPRQILSGIREYIEDPQALVGQMFPYVVNLAPRVIRGYESQGMILAGMHEDSLMLLEPSVDVPPGTKIK